MRSKELDLGLIKLNETEKYFNIIKEHLSKESSYVDNLFFIPFDYDDFILEDMCENEEIDMWYSSSYGDDKNIYNPYCVNDKIHFKKRVRAK